MNKEREYNYNADNYYLSPNSNLYLNKVLMKPFQKFIKTLKTKKQRAAMEISLLNTVYFDSNNTVKKNKELEKLKLYLEGLSTFFEKTEEIVGPNLVIDNIDIDNLSKESIDIIRNINNELQQNLNETNEKLLKLL